MWRLPSGGQRVSDQVRETASTRICQSPHSGTHTNTHAAWRTRERSRARLTCTLPQLGCPLETAHNTQACTADSAAVVWPCSNNKVSAWYIKDRCDNVRKSMDQRGKVWIFHKQDLTATNKDKLMNYWKIYQTFSTKFRWWSQMNSKCRINKSTRRFDVEYPNFDWLDYDPHVLRNWSPQRQKFVLCVNFFCRPQKNSTRPAPAADLKRHGCSIHSWNSSRLLAPHCSSNSRRALSDSVSCHLHEIPHIRFYTQGSFFLYLFPRLRMQLSQAEMCRSMQDALFSTS